MKLTNNIGKALCLILYLITMIIGAMKKRWLPFLLLFLTHFSEFFLFGNRVGKKAGLSKGKSFLNTLAFGFTWWLPLNDEINEKMRQENNPEKFKNKGRGIRFVPCNDQNNH